MLKNKRAQALIEYAIVFAAVVSAIVLMNNYFKNALNAKLKRTAVGLNSVFLDMNN